MPKKFFNVVVLACAVAVAADLSAQRAPGGGFGRGGGAPGGREGGEESAIKPYDEVITDEAVTKPGLFLVHQIDDKIFYELPAEALDKEMLWVTQVAKTQAGFGYGGTSVGDRVVRWVKRGDQILLRDVDYRIRAEGEDSVRLAVEATSLEPIIMAFPVKAYGKDQRPVIEVTALFTSDLNEFSAARRLNASGADSSRTFIEEVKAFPENINTKVLMTYRLQSQERTQGQGGPTPSPFPRGERRDPTQSAVTVLLHHSMVLLPAAPMQPRQADERVGFFSVSFEDFASEEHFVDEIEYITRWRLEKQDPNAEVSDPVKPIVFYIGREVPDKWKPYVRKGIEAWQPAFAAAGFSNAIIAKDAPSPQEDPDWDAEDARISSIRWLPSTTENAMGPHVNDPRTGEILESDIIVYHNILKLVRDWYFVQASPNDERAQTLPMPDDLIGELLAYVIAHEVGHTLGFPHNMKASSAYTIEQLRDPEFTKQYGTEASIMDYGRFNYVAQPGDGAALIPVIGPYDFFAIDWGYRQYGSDDEEQAALATLVAKQKENPQLLFGGGNASEDPTDQTEDLGADPIAATELGLANLDRVAGYLINATCKPGEDYELLENMYQQVLGQRNRELGHVVNVVGGFDRRNFWFGDADRVYNPVDAARQRDAVAFLNQNAFHVPVSLVTDEIILRLEASGTADRILQSQRGILNSLLNESRLKRMAEQVERDPAGAYSPRDLLVDLRSGIFSELQESIVDVTLYRRNLQRAFVEMLIEQVKRTDATSDLPALARGELEALRALLTRGFAEGSDEVSRLHVLDLHARIVQTLEGDFAEPATAAASPAVGRPGSGGEPGHLND
jgi:hypothetical protein